MFLGFDHTFRMIVECIRKIILLIMAQLGKTKNTYIVYLISDILLLKLTVYIWISFY